MAGEDLFERAVGLHRAGCLEEARTLYLRVLKEAPDHADALNLLGCVEFEIGTPETARDLMTRALDLVPGNPVFLHNRAEVLGALGDFSAAETDLRDALERDPAYVPALFALADQTRPAPDDLLADRMRHLLSTESTPDGDRCLLHFALGAIHDAAGNWDAAFTHFAQGNRLKDVSWSAKDTKRDTTAIAAALTREFLESRGNQGCPDDRPVFVVGMPRSGTSLVEQVLASHPQVFGAGELRDMDAIANTLGRHVPGEPTYPESARAMPPDVQRGFGEAYIRRIADLAPMANRIIDKHPLNFRHLGLIALLLPRARIIHVRRDPRDTCLSCFFQNFAQPAQGFSFDLSDLGQFYRSYARLMEHWRTHLPTPITEIRYEDLVADLEGEAQRLIAALNLDWDPKCIDFHTTRRPVQTASRHQVRRPVYGSSVGRWKHYAAHLGPLLDALGD